MIRLTCYPIKSGIGHNLLSSITGAFLGAQKPFMIGTTMKSFQIARLEIDNGVFTLKIKSGDFDKEYEIIENIPVNDVTEFKILTKENKKYINFITPTNKYSFSIDSDISKEHEEAILKVFKNQ
ncbi:hypothetical protein [uncultured Clostridium sp.]|jgi:hypothetical protein|uniref:hypothetical protein n=1 Tax=uncultured Clostridium sp. TaxID=59620 RepID=UPI002613DDD4|nr:hypothetical protein [uncultured Clostridium sp.]